MVAALQDAGYSLALVETNTAGELARRACDPHLAVTRSVPRTVVSSSCGNWSMNRPTWSVQALVK